MLLKMLVSITSRKLSKSYLQQYLSIYGIHYKGNHEVSNMQTFFEIVLIITIFLSIIPVINMFRNRNDKKYACLKILIYATFFWTILIVLERVASSHVLIYYVGMLGYPLKLLFAALMLCTIFEYVEKIFPKPLKVILGVLVLLDLIVALSNSSTLLFLDLNHNQLSSFNDLYTSNHGPLFIYHLALSYLVALCAIVLLIVFLSKRKGIRQYKEVTRMMVVSVCAVILFNAIQLLVFDININLTYISLVFVAYILYDVIYRKDMVFNLRTSGRGEILSNMREMYILTDAEKRIIEISPLIIEKYQLSLDEVIGQRFEDIVSRLDDKVVLYSDYKTFEDSNSDKDHYHLREKEFYLKGMKDSGHMILLYDETQVYSLLRELNQLSNYDMMTGLNNRNYIEYKLKHYQAKSLTSVISLDLNGLKINNDYLGHERGDFLLKSLSHQIKKVFSDIPKKDIGRIGGDEFIILVYGIQADQINQKISDLQMVCENEDIEKTISVSIGFAFDEKGDQNIYDLIQTADARMYDMKSTASKAYRQKLIEFIELKDKVIR
ncbi:MAG TPA: hypothetical protein DHV05_00980 [Acholeplasmataceae bacterium]|nr:hypothetical protein [Acholeplasmataceae bacterium]